MGLSISGEYIAAKNDYGVAIAPLAAVGLDASGPVGKRGWTLGFFTSILDLGQLVSARVTEGADQKGEEGAATASEVAFISVLSPGAYFKIGIGQSPFTMGAGAGREGHEQRDRGVGLARCASRAVALGWRAPIESTCPRRDSRVHTAASLAGFEYRVTRAPR